MQAMQQRMIQDPEAMARMMDNPMIQSLMDNPELMRGMMRANPQMRALLESNPELARALEDPNLLRQSMRAMRARQDSAENFSRLDALLSHSSQPWPGFSFPLIELCTS